MSLVFAAIVFAQWRRRRRPFQLVWTVGLVWYALAAGSEAWSGLFGWSEPAYRLWYLTGALFVAAYLGMGTFYLLARTRFGYFAAVTIVGGGLFAILSQLRLIREGHPTEWTNVAVVIAFATLAGLAVAYATWRHRDSAAHVAMAFLAAASVVMAAQMLTAPIAAPGYAVDPDTLVPIGEAIPGHIRITTGPFNIFGAFTLVFGALYSAYAYLPKRAVLGGRVRVPALPTGELPARVPGTLLIALGGFIPGVTSGLNRFGITWAFFLGELLGVLLIFAGVRLLASRS